jgi:hypothetical protein
MLTAGKKEHSDLVVKLVLPLELKKTDDLGDLGCQICTFTSQGDIFSELGGQNGIPGIFRLTFLSRRA